MSEENIKLAKIHNFAKKFLQPSQFDNLKNYVNYQKNLIPFNFKTQKTRNSLNVYDISNGSTRYDWSSFYNAFLNCSDETRNN